MKAKTSTKKKSASKAPVHNDSFFTQQEFDDFMDGLIVPCRSSNVAFAQYNADGGYLLLWFHSGHCYKYAVSEALAISFGESKSKGKWRHTMFPKGSGGVTRVS